MEEEEDEKEDIAYSSSSFPFNSQKLTPTFFLGRRSALQQEEVL